MWKKLKDLFSGGAKAPIPEVQGEADRWQSFPYELVKVKGTEALSEWEALVAADPNTTPVILGSAENVDRIAQAFDPSRDVTSQGGPEQTLALADALTFPDGIVALRVAGLKGAESVFAKDEEGKQEFATLMQQAEAGLDGIPDELMGNWPDAPTTGGESGNGLTVIQNWKTGQAFDEVYIAILPTDDPTSAPAYLRFGGWNENPAPEYHVAALRAWHSSYGARLIGISGDTMNLRAARRPASQDEALELAKEQYLYCEDIVTQGVGTVSDLAATLFAEDWWYFWWD